MDVQESSQKDLDRIGGSRRIGTNFIWFHSKIAVEIGSPVLAGVFTTFLAFWHQSWKENRSGKTTEAKGSIRLNKQGDHEAVGRNSIEERWIPKIKALLSSLSTTSVSLEGLPLRSAI